MDGDSDHGSAVGACGKAPVCNYFPLHMHECEPAARMAGRLRHATRIYLIARYKVSELTFLLQNIL